jgi:hypothetical protein
MVPLSYIVIAIAIAGGVAVGLYATQFFAIFTFYYAFSAAALVLAAVGIVRVTQGLDAPLWVTLALLSPLVSPLIVWVLTLLRDTFDTTSVYTVVSRYLGLIAVLALTAAAIGCVKIVEILTAPSLLTRAVSIILVLSMAIPLLVLFQQTVGGVWTRSSAYAETMNLLRWPITVAKFGALGAAAIVLVVKRRLEVWTLVPLVGLLAILIDIALFPQHLLGDGRWFWIQPVVYFVAAAAIWRLGALLRSQQVAA